MGNPFKRTQPRHVGTDRLLLFTSTAAAATLERPKARVAGPVPTTTCETCGKPLEERILATAAPGSEAGLWNEAPFAVDGWACEVHGTLAYPSRLRKTQDGHHVAAALENRIAPVERQTGAAASYALPETVPERGVGVCAPDRALTSGADRRDNRIPSNRWGRRPATVNIGRSPRARGSSRRWSASPLA